MTLITVCLVVALVCFVLAAINVAQKQVNLIAVGLAFWVLAQLLPHVQR